MECNKDIRFRCAPREQSCKLSEATLKQTSPLGSSHGFVQTAPMGSYILSNGLGLVQTSPMGRYILPHVRTDFPMSSSILSRGLPQWVHPMGSYRLQDGFIHPFPWVRTDFPNGFLPDGFIHTFQTSPLGSYILPHGFPRWFMHTF